MFFMKMRPLIGCRIHTSRQYMLISLANNIPGIPVYAAQKTGN